MAAWVGVSGRMDTCIHMAEYLHYSPETLTTLLTSYTAIQNKKLFLKKVVFMFLLVLNSLRTSIWTTFQMCSIETVKSLKTCGPREISFKYSFTVWKEIFLCDNFSLDFPDMSFKMEYLLKILLAHIKTNIAKSYLRKCPFSFIFLYYCNCVSKFAGMLSAAL